MGTLTTDMMTSALRLFSLGYSILAVAGMLDVPLEALGDGTSRSLERLYRGCVEEVAA